MSTAGSVRSDGATGYGPPSSAGAPATPNEPPPARQRTRIFRWRGLLPLALGLGLMYAAWALFGERVVRDTLREAGTKALGTQLDIAQVVIDELHTTVELRGIALADPFDVHRNLLEAKLLRVELEPDPLLEKKLVLRRLSIGEVRTGTQRATPARPVTGGGFAPSMLREMDRWAKQFDVPLLSLTPVDTIRAIVLDPTQLASVRAALALVTRADSVRGTLEQSYRSLRLQETLDSAQALLTRLQGANLRALGVTGARTALADTRRAVARVDSARRRVEALATAARTAADTLQLALRSVDDARRADYAFARGLLKLPSFDAPNMGAALFGKVTIDRFQQALYWTTLARQYAPPGLLPKESDGPKRLRRAGSTVHFAKAMAYPRFLLRRGDVSVTVSDGPARGTYALAATDVTTEPALVGRPTMFALRRSAKGEGRVDSLRVTGMLDHVSAHPRDVITASVSGVRLPSLPLPVLPYKAEPGRGTTEMRFALEGDRVAAHWSLASGTLTWREDSSRVRALNAMESLVARLLTGIGVLEIDAELNGPVRSPKLSVRSNLDRVNADRLRAVAGEQVLAAEARVRTQVDRLVEEKTAPIKTRIADLRAETDRRLADARAKLDTQKQKLDAQVKTLTGGLVGLPKLPGN